MKSLTKHLIIFVLLLNIFLFAKEKKKIGFYPKFQEEKSEQFFNPETLNYDVGIVKIISPDNFISRQRTFPIVKIKNFGRLNAENFLVKLMIRELGYWDIKNIDLLLPFSETIITFNSFIPNESIRFNLRCTVDFSLDEDSSNNLKEKRVFVYDYFENFEESEGDFISLPEGAFCRLRWGRNNDWCFVSCDNVGENYHDMANFFLKSPSFFALIDSPIVAFWHKYNIEFYYDGYNVKCSTENSNWQLLHAIPDLGQRYSTVASIYNLGIRGESCYSGYSDWQINYLRIPVLRNTRFYLRFDFGSDNADNEQGGAFIDNIYGIGFSNLSPYFCLEIKEFSYPKEPVGRIYSIFRPNVKVKNYSQINCENVFLRLRIKPGDYFSERVINNLLPNQEAEVIFDYCQLDSVYNIFLCSLYYYAENNYIHSLSKIVFAYDYYEDFIMSDGYYRANRGWQYSSYFGLLNNPGGWGMADYVNLANWILKSPTFYALVDTPIIAYWHKYENEYRFDGYNVKCSVFSSPWQIIHAYPDLGHRYDTVARPSNAGIPNESCYAGYYPWRINYLKIPARSGDFFKIAFHFGSDYDEEYYGTEIDKIYGIGFQRRILYDVGIKEILTPDTLVKQETILPCLVIKNYGERSARDFSVYFYIDNYIDSIYLRELLPERETLLAFSPFRLPSGQIRYRITYEVKFSLDEVWENNEVNFEFYVYRYLEDFEAGRGGYLALPETGWKYLNINNNWVFTTSIYENNANWKLLSPRFVARVNRPILAYRHEYNTEYGKDGYNVKCSISYSPRWQIVYPYNVIYDGRVGAGNAGIPDEECFTGNKNWRLVFFELPVNIGSSFYLSFHFGSDSINSDLGVIIDQIYGVGFDTIFTAIEEFDYQELFFIPLILRKPILINLPKEEDITIKIFDITGKLVYGKREFAKRVVIKKSLPKGVYFIKIKSNSLNIERKVIFEL